MKKKLFILLYGLSSAAIGACIGCKLLDEKIRKEYEKLLLEISSSLYKQSDTEESSQSNSEEELSNESFNNEDYVDYVKYSEYTDTYTTSNIEEDEKISSKKPKIIKKTEFGDYAEYDTDTLIYYTEDSILTDEDDNIIHNIDELIGDSLEKFNFKSNDEKSLYVRCFSLSTDYEIVKINGNYGDSH